MRIDQSIQTPDPVQNVARDASQVQADNREIIQAVRIVGAHANLGSNNEITVFLDRKTRQPVIKIVNRQTGEVVEQIPNERILRLAEDIKGLA